MTEPALFEVPPELLHAHLAPEPEKLSADRRRTLRQRRDVNAGRHPLTETPTHPELGTCGDCRFRAAIAGHTKSYPKCLWERDEVDDSTPRRYRWPRVTSGAASDVRAWWPACGDFKPRTDAP